MLVEHTIRRQPMGDVGNIEVFFFSLLMRHLFTVINLATAVSLDFVIHEQKLKP